MIEAAIWPDRLSRSCFHRTCSRLRPQSWRMRLQLRKKKNIKTNQVLKSVSKSVKNGKVPVMCLKTVKFLVHTASHWPSPWVMNLGTFFFSYSLMRMLRGRTLTFPTGLICYQCPLKLYLQMVKVWRIKKSHSVRLVSGDTAEAVLRSCAWVLLLLIPFMPPLCYCHHCHL